MQEITVTGHLGRDAQVRQSSNSGENFISFTLASNTFSKGEKRTTWFDVVANSTKKTQNMVPYLKSGSNVIVIGELQASLYETPSGESRIRLSIYADRLEFNGVEKKGDDNNGQTTKPTATKPTPAAKPAPKKADDEEITMTSAHTDDSSDEELPF
jgi:single-strand DNA-binding protein